MVVVGPAGRPSRHRGCPPPGVGRGPRGAREALTDERLLALVPQLRRAEAERKADEAERVPGTILPTPARRPATPPSAPAPGAGTADPVDALVLLREAAAEKAEVWVELVGSHGVPQRRLLRPLRVEGGRLRAIDPARESELTVAVHRIAYRHPPRQHRQTSNRGDHVTDGPLIVQSDKTLLLEVDHDQAEACRRAIAPFAELERAPEHVHTYRLTPLGLWNARAAGHDAEQVVDVLLEYSRYPVPHALLVDVADTMSRYGRLQLIQDPVHGLILHALDPAVLVEVVRSKRTAGLLGARIDATDVIVHPSERGHLKQVLLKLGWPAEDLAGLRRRRGAPDRPARGRLGAAARTSSRPSTASSTAAPASWCCPAAPARRWSARGRWPGRRRRR